MVIRKAAEKDRPMILRLMEQLIEEHRRLDAYYKPFAKYRGLKDYIADAATDENKLLLVAENDGMIIGYFLGIIEEAPFYSVENYIGVVADAAVDKKYRRRGALAALFKEALEWFRKKGVNYIELSVDIRNAAAVAAWRRMGFAEYKYRMRRPV